MIQTIEIPLASLAKSLKERNRGLSKGEYKHQKLNIKPDPTAPRLAKPNWIRARVPTADKAQRVTEIKQLLREKRLSSVCEEASCPNLPECFSHGTATFMIMGDICTRKCPFCDVAHGRPNALDTDEPVNLADSIQVLGLRYVVITSVDRDDLRDGGAEHFARCVKEIRLRCPDILVEILTPDFRRTENTALESFLLSPPDVFNHNLETVPRLYEEVRPGADYRKSLELLQAFGDQHPNVPTKSGIMVGLGEEKDEVLEVIRDLRSYGVQMLTIGQYLQPSRFHLAVQRYVHPDEFAEYREYAESLGFRNVASGPMVRSSYHADLQASSIVEPN